MGPLSLAGLGAAAGGVQALIGARGARRARRELEQLPTPQYERSRSITDYYNQALNRYQQSPTQSNLYKMQAQQIARGTAQGLSALGDRRSAMAGVPNLVQAQNDAYLKAAAAAEQDQSQKFAQLGGASEAMAGEDRMAFQVNKMMPFQRKSELLGQKAAGYTQLMNAGLQNIYGGLTGGMYASTMMKNPQSSSADTNSYDDYNMQRRMSPRPFTMQTVPY